MGNEQHQPFEQTNPVNSSAQASEGQKLSSASTTLGTPTASQSQQTADESQQQSDRNLSPSPCDAVAEAAATVQEAFNHAALEANQAAVKKTAEAIEAIAAAAETGKAAMETAAGVGEAIATAAFQSGQVAVDAAAEMAQAAAKQTQQMVERALEGAGQAMTFISDNPVLQQIAKVFRADWLLNLFGQVDVIKAEEAVKKLEEEYPDETPSQLAHRLMVEKSLYAGGIGFASSILPGVAAALLAVDLAATTLLQAQMVYQIAALYGLDLKDPARKGEVLAIFGLSLGGTEAIKVGVGFLRNVPLAGMAIGASTNAVMMYALGYAACRFYEAKVNPLSSEASAEAFTKDSEKYIEQAIAQQMLMDQILVHMILASHPEKSWSDILPELQSMHFSTLSLQLIAAHIESPQPLDKLLGQLNSDYASAVLAQCYRIAQLDGIITPEESRVITAIASKFNIDMNAIETVVNSEAAAYAKT